MVDLIEDFQAVRQYRKFSAVRSTVFTKRTVRIPLASKYFLWMWDSIFAVLAYAEQITRR